MDVVNERCAGLDVHKNPHGHPGELAIPQR